MRFLIACCGILAFLSSASAQPVGDAFFEAKIRPVLVKHCYSCHSDDSKKAKGGLKVDTRAALLKGGDSGAAVVPKSVEKSLLYKAIAYQDKSMQMPPDGKLPDSVIADFKKWIEMGAPDPRGAKTGLAVQAKIDIAKGREYWAYRAPTKPVLPAVQDANWAFTDIDRFILHQLEQNNLKPVKDADKATLLCLVYFDRLSS